MDKDLALFNGNLDPCNDGQKALAILISKKYRQKDLIEYDELKDIWQCHVQRSFGWEGQIWDFNPETGCYDILKEEPFIPFDELTIERKVKDWTSRAIGSLVKKGYLTVIPKIDFSKEVITRE